MKAPPSRIFGVLVACLALTLLGLAVLAGSVLRETPLFWHNAGGYPLEMRELVLAGFYPAFGIYFFSLMFGSFAGWQLLRARWQSGGTLLLACGLNWLLFTAITGLVVWNNVENVMNGRPPHYHAP